MQYSLMHKIAHEYMETLPFANVQTVRTIEWGFRRAVLAGNLDMVKCFFNISPQLCPVQWAFEVAVDRGLTPIVAYLISIGTKGHCYIVNACTNGHLDVVKLLVESGASCRFLNDWPICLAARGGHLAIVEYLIAGRSDFSVDRYLPLRWASANDHFELVKFLVGLGSPVDLVTPRQQKYVAFCAQMKEKRRVRAQKKIYFWWIPICYDITREVGKRMRERNYEAFKMLY